ncbi:RNA polymerase II-associated [Zalerion maritima]|uniref:RNA polymerase II-associated n=1 Tax=Zalerion maritima TaxID=339359 RepID=A0AAD5RXC9_9PEZI|nr:RNA polymerase II-associated [Zalerion maritima]
MASSSRGGRDHVHQDYIARIRYSNALPPPPNPPKLLDMPSTGLLDSQYTTPAFASRIAREQTLNIEADAEMGMHLDLVGLPGVFDGDDSVVEITTPVPLVHPNDAPLLRPLHSLGKPRVNEGGVSFLRRTEYTAAMNTRKSAANPFMPQPKRQAPKKRASPEPVRDSPAYIKRKIDESFVAAKRFRDGHFKHPSRKTAKLQGSMPLLPDLEAFPDSGAYVTIKFANNPVPKSTVYDSRMAAGILRPLERTEDEEAAYEAALADWEESGRRGPQPPLSTNYDFYLADGPSTASNFHKKLDLSNPDRDDDELYTNRNASSGGVFSYKRLRAYETAKETELDHQTKYNEELLFTLAENPDGRGQVAYYLPVMQRTTLQAQRAKNIARTVGMRDEQDNVIDQLDIRIDEPTQDMLDAIQLYKDNPEYSVPPQEEIIVEGEDDDDDEEMIEEVDVEGHVAARRGHSDDDNEGQERFVDADADADADEDGDGFDGHNATQVAPRDFGGDDDEDEDDAEGEEDED